MKKPFLFWMLALLLAWFWFGGISMAEEYQTSTDGLQSVWDYVYSVDSWNTAYNKPNSPYKAYEDYYRPEDLYSGTLERVAQIIDLRCDFTWICKLND